MGPICTKIPYLNIKVSGAHHILDLLISGIYNILKRLIVSQLSFFLAGKFYLNSPSPPYRPTIVNALQHTQIKKYYSELSFIV
jgi:hypothetical protein